MLDDSGTLDSRSGIRDANDGQTMTFPLMSKFAKFIESHTNSRGNIFFALLMKMCFVLTFKCNKLGWV